MPQLKRKHHRWMFQASAQTVERLRQLASEEPAGIIARLIRAPNVQCVYNLAKAHNIALTAGRRGGPTLAHHFTETQYAVLMEAATKRGLDRYEMYKRAMDSLFSDRHVLNNVVDDDVVLT